MAVVALALNCFNEAEAIKPRNLNLNINQHLLNLMLQ